MISSFQRNVELLCEQYSLCCCMSNSEHSFFDEPVCVLRYVLTSDHYSLLRACLEFDESHTVWNPKTLTFSLYLAVIPRTKNHNLVIRHFDYKCGTQAEFKMNNDTGISVKFRWMTSFIWPIIHRCGNTRRIRVHITLIIVWEIVSFVTVLSKSCWGIVIQFTIGVILDKIWSAASLTE